MKNLKKIFFLLFAAIAVVLSCVDDDQKLGKILDKSQVSFEVIQDYDTDDGGNVVILKNNTPGTVPIWDYGTGRSNRQQDTVIFPFEGEYTIKLSLLTAGGIVELDPQVIEVEKNNVNYLSDPLWALLSGGVDQEKTWLLDIDASGTCKYFSSPLYFYGTDNGWEEACTKDGGDCWDYKPSLPGDSWVMPGAEYGSMTFNLKGGPYVTAEHLQIPGRGVESGTYVLFPESKTMRMTDATFIHDPGRDDCVDDWGDIKLFSLTEETMQLAVLRKNSCEGAALLVYNFISKEYSDNWEPDGD